MFSSYECGRQTYTDTQTCTPAHAVAHRWVLRAPPGVASALDLNGRCEARRGEVRSPPVSLCFSEYSKAFLLANDNHAIRLRIWRHFASNVRKKRGDGLRGLGIGRMRRHSTGTPPPRLGSDGARGAASIPFHRRPCLSAEGPRRR